MKLFIEEELRYLAPSLPGIVKAFYDANWGPWTSEFSPQVDFLIPFHKGLWNPLERHGRIFELLLYTDDDEKFHLYVDEWHQDRRDDVVAEATFKFSDWGMLDVRNSDEEKND